MDVKKEEDRLQELERRRREGRSKKGGRKAGKPEASAATSENCSQLQFRDSPRTTSA